MNSKEDRHLGPPPRQIDFFTQSILIFGGLLNQIGWFFIGFGMLFFWVAFTFSGFESIFQSTKGWEEIRGTIDQISATNTSVNDQRVYQYDYNFRLNSQIYAGQSFTNGQQFDIGDKVSILFNFNNPEQSVIKGAKRNELSPWILAFLLIFPVVGCILVIIQTRTNLKNLNLLKIGDSTKAKNIDKQSTGGSVTINNKRYPIYKFTFEFSYKDHIKEGIYQAVCKTHLSDLVEDEEREIVLFDKFEPKINTVYDAIPNAPMIDSDGNILSAEPLKAFGLIIPGLTIFGNIIYLLLQFL